MDTGRTVVFDLGEVLVSSTGVLPLVASELGVTQAQLEAAYWPPRAEYDRGGDAGAYWRAVLDGLGLPADDEIVHRVTALDADKWSALPAESARLLAALDGERLGVLSNAPVPLADAVRAAPWSRAIDVLVFSADLGLLKPDPRIYAQADAAYGTRPQDVIFFDDRPDNVEAARAHGWQAHVWPGPDEALRLLSPRI